MKQVTIKDIAKALQVNISTVSRALNNHPDISDAVKKRVKETASLLQYVPNSMASNLRNNKSKLIGLIVPEISMFFIPSVINGISKKLNQKNYNFFVLSSEESLEKEIENIEICCNSRVEGIMLSLTHQTQNLEHLQKAKELEIPIVLFDKTIHQELYDQVIIDNQKMAADCVRVLIEKGCKNIFAVFGNNALDITKERTKGFEEYIKQHPKVKYTIFNANNPEEAKWIAEQYYNNTIYDGIFVMSDEILAGINASFNPSLIDVNALQLVAISNGDLPQYFNPNFQYIKHDGYKLGKLTAKVLLSQINPKTHKNNKRIHFLEF